MVLLAVAPSAFAQQTSIFATDVFNWRFYLNNNPDLIAAGIVTEQGAKNHWQSYGRSECRRSHPTFDVKQYLDRYADLKNHYGADCVGAINHFITYGRNEGRQGLLGTYYGGRVTVGNGTITVGLSTRVAGAIDSLYSGGREYINSWDHGRQMQFAWSVNNEHECNNPTEAGSSSNGIHKITSSNWVSHSEAGSTLTTVSYPAFWLKPTDRSDCANAQQVSGHKLEKYVQVGIPNVSDRLIEILGEVTIPAPTTHFVLEAPSTHVGSEFSVFYIWNPSNCQLTALSGPPQHEQSQPVILSVPGGSAAIGQWSPDLPSPGYSTYGYGASHIIFPGNDADSESKINAVYRKDNVPAGTYLTETFVAVGTLAQVQTALCVAKANFG